ncbi:MAG: hypothetical protein ACK55I_00165, partial [bacterium]
RSNRAAAAQPARAVLSLRATHSSDARVPIMPRENRAGAGWVPAPHSPDDQPGRAVRALERAPRLPPPLCHMPTHRAGPSLQRYSGRPLRGQLRGSRTWISPKAKCAAD